MSAPSTTAGHKVVLVTGASGGVGRGIAHACGEAGWTVWIAARRAVEGEQVAAEVDALGGEGHFVACDASLPDDVTRTIATIVSTSGRLDGVVLNATSGLSPKPAVFGEVPIAELEDHVAVSLRGLHLLALSAYEHLRAVGGSFVVLTSEAGFEGKAKLSVYAGVKAAQRGMVRSLAREWGPSGVRVNCVAPLAGTPAMERAFEMDPDMAERILARNPLGRLGDPSTDVGPIVRFLLADESRYLTGNTLMADGGSCPIS
ncbi:MAG: family oxidoreductase [Ilumatobacteraceae bacterium]|nr:family oxidoreductase [Ilumatobacteraceae bacterium]